MTVKPNYFKIGIFVIAGVLLIIGGIIFFSSGVFEKKKIYVETYFADSVSGLNIGAPLQDRGVRVGQVERISFATRQYIKNTDHADFIKFAPYVLVVCSVDTQNMRTPGNTEEIMADIARGVKAGYRLRLATNILTGQAMVEGVFLDPNTYPPLEVPWKPDNLYIPSDALDRLNLTLLRIDQLLSSQGPNINQTLINLREASANIRDMTENLKSNPSDIIFSKPPPPLEKIR